MHILSWINTVISILGTVMVSRKKRNGFIIWFVTDIIWVAYNISIGAYAQGCLFLVYGGLAVYGYFFWKKTEA